MTLSKVGKYDIIDAVIDNSLFKQHKKINDKSMLQSDSFGVFVTVLRSIYQNKSKYTSKSAMVHGCIGYWNDDYTQLSQIEQINYLLKVGYDSVHNDQRRYNFNESLYVDITSEFEITFMKLPLMMIDKSGIITELGHTFNNMEYGLIVKDNTSGFRATYLPEVFENAQWDTISKELLNKAHITNNNNVKFYAYRGIVFKRRIIDRFTSPFLNLMHKYFTLDDGVPYSVKGTSSLVEQSSPLIEYNDNENVRNVATVRDVITALHLNNKDTMKHSLTKIINTYINKYAKLFLSSESNLNMYRQSLPFLLQCLNATNDHSKIIAKYLVLNIDDIRKSDPFFEYGEVLSGLGYYLYSLQQENKENKSYTDIERIIGECIIKEIPFIKEQISEMKIDSNSIFQINWLAQSTRFIYFNRSTYNNDTDINTTIHLIINKLSSITNILLRDSRSESNYYCVAFEGFCSLYHVSMDIDKAYCLNMIKKLFKHIVKRINYYGCVEFTSGDARIDITGHFLNGLSYLILHNNHSAENIEYNEDNKTYYSSGGGHKTIINSYLSHYIYNKKMYLELSSQLKM